MVPAVARGEGAAGRRSVAVHLVAELDDRRTVIAVMNHVMRVVGPGATEIGPLPPSGSVDVEPDPQFSPRSA